MCIRDRLDTIAEQGKEAVLLYAARTPADLAFRSEIDAIVKTHPNIRVTYLVESQEGDMMCRVGRINEACLRTYLDDAHAWDAYVCGPPIMMENVTDILRSMGMPKGHIHSERFSW